MFKQYYLLGHLQILLELPEKININQLALHLPEIKELNQENVFMSVHLKISFQNTHESSLTIKENQIFLKGLWNENSKNDMPHLVYSLFRQYCINNQAYPIHSIVINDNLLIANTGMGKTTLVLEAIKQNCSIFSTDRTILKFQMPQLMTQLGTSVISIRQHLSYLIDETKTPIIDKQERIICSYHKEKTAPIIKKIILFNLNNNPLVMEKISPQSALHQLYPYFLDTIKQDVVLSNHLLFEGVIKTESKKQLIDNLTQWLKTHEVYFYSGNKESIIRQLK